MLTIEFGSFFSHCTTKRLCDGLGPQIDVKERAEVFLSVLVTFFLEEAWQRVMNDGSERSVSEKEEEERY